MINTVVLMGRITDFPELKTTQNDKKVTSFTIANDQGYGDNKKTHFINAVAWNKTAEFISKYFSKGQMIAIEGSLTSRRYEDKHGNKRTIYEVLVNEANFCGDKAKSEDNNSSSQSSSFSQNSNFEEYEQIDIGASEDLPF